MKPEDKWFRKDIFELRKYQLKLQVLILGVEGEKKRVEFCLRALQKKSPEKESRKSESGEVEFWEGLVFVYNS